jgi:hypothetical protein
MNRILVCLACMVALPSWVGCGGAAQDARYPAREPGCPVRSYPGASGLPVDELGTVRVECGAGGSCERQLLDAVCARGGDVAWGTADNTPSATALVAHAAHTKRATQGPRGRGCAVQVFTDSPPGATENIGAVSAICNEDDSSEVCLRELQDQVCLLGGDVLWQVDGPTHQDTQNGPRQRMRGRAAHSK